MTDRILVTGADGFIGSVLCRRLRGAGFLVREAVRTPEKLSVGGTAPSNDLDQVVLHDRSSEAETHRALQGVQAVVHLAARVHVMSEQAADPMAEFRQVNPVWTERLARSAASQGVRRFVYMSSVKVNGERSTKPLTEQDAPCPQDAYAISKWDAEQALARVSAQTSLETVVIRSPLVYGPGVGGNFLHLLKILRRSIPLPFASIQNKRSLIFLGNLVDALAYCIRETRAAGQTYLVADGEDLSTPDLLRRLGQALNVQVRLWRVPPMLLRWMGRIVGQRGAIDRLVGSLQVDTSKIRKDLGWRPPWTVGQGLEETAAWFRKTLA